jgi:hypothetical protein
MGRQKGEGQMDRFETYLTHKAPTRLGHRERFSDSSREKSTSQNFGEGVTGLNQYSEIWEIFKVPLSEYKNPTVQFDTLSGELTLAFPAGDKGLVWELDRLFHWVLLEKKLLHPVRSDWRYSEKEIVCRIQDGKREIAKRYASQFMNTLVQQCELLGLVDSNQLFSLIYGNYEFAASLGNGQFDAQAFLNLGLDYPGLSSKDLPDLTDSILRAATTARHRQNHDVLQRLIPLLCNLSKTHDDCLHTVESICGLYPAYVDLADPHLPDNHRGQLDVAKARRALDAQDFSKAGHLLISARRQGLSLGSLKGLELIEPCATRFLRIAEDACDDQKVALANHCVEVLEILALLDKRVLNDLESLAISCSTVMPGLSAAIVKILQGKVGPERLINLEVAKLHFAALTNAMNVLAKSGLEPHGDLGCGFALVPIDDECVPYRFRDDFELALGLAKAWAVDPHPSYRRAFDILDALIQQAVGDAFAHSELQSGVDRCVKLVDEMKSAMVAVVSTSRSPEIKKRADRFKAYFEAKKAEFAKAVERRQPFELAKAAASRVGYQFARDTFRLIRPARLTNPTKHLAQLRVLAIAAAGNDLIPLVADVIKLLQPTAEGALLIEEIVQQLDQRSQRRLKTALAI